MGLTALDREGKKVYFDDHDAPSRAELRCPCCGARVAYALMGRKDAFFEHENQTKCELARFEGTSGNGLRRLMLDLRKRLQAGKRFFISLTDGCMFSLPERKSVELEYRIESGGIERFCVATFSDIGMNAAIEIIPDDADKDYIECAIEFYRQAKQSAFLIRQSGLGSTIANVNKGEYVIFSMSDAIRSMYVGSVGFTPLSELAGKMPTMDEPRNVEKDEDESVLPLDDESLNIDNLTIDEKVKDALRGEGITKLYPPQAEALKFALAGKSVVLAIPTASGKSLVAYLAMLRSIIEDNGKALYIVPLRALASEKVEDLQRFANVLGLKVGCSVGDYDSPDPTLDRFDIIVATCERADSLLRHRSRFIDMLTVVVADEVHLINDPSRGHILEVILARLKQSNPKIQFIALSATIRNSKELAAWIDAHHISSNWRPVILKEGVLCHDTITFKDGSKRKIALMRDAPTSLVMDTLNEGAQCLVFVNTRRGSESLAKVLAGRLGKKLTEEEKQVLSDVKESLVGSQTEKTSMCDVLGDCILRGTAFHNAGLTNEQRKVVENAFKERKLKCIVATPTLAAGVNLPARRVVVRDLYRYDGEGAGMIPVLEVRQMLGRAGRPKYDKEGEAILLAKDEQSAEEIARKYIFGPSERMESKLGTEPALRTHLLAAVATRYASTVDEIWAFIEHTFFAYQQKRTGNLKGLKREIANVLEFLIKNDLIKPAISDEALDDMSTRDITSQEITEKYTLDDKANYQKFDDPALSKMKLRPTLFGLRVSQLYIDPLSGVKLREALEFPMKNSANVTHFSFLHAICTTPDMSKANMYLKKDDYEPIMLVAMQRDSELLKKRPRKYDEDYDFFLSEIKTACLFDDWTAEAPENTIAEKYEIGPGDIRTKVEYAEWLLYSMKELARLFNPSLVRPLENSLERVKYGVRDELLELVSLRGIGRKRARSLYLHGFKTLGDLLISDEKMIASVDLVGPVLARSIKEQVEKLASRSSRIDDTHEAEGFVSLRGNNGRPEVLNKARNGEEQVGNLKEGTNESDEKKKGQRTLFSF